MQSLFSPHGHGKVPSVSGLGSGVLKLAIAFGTADGAVLYTVPAGHNLRINRAWWNVQTAFTGGSSSAIGIDSSNAAYNTAGDILGGASGDVEASLAAGQKGGTVGAKMSGNQVVVLVPGDTIRFQRITSAFAAGAGYLMLEVSEVGDDLT
jgi:hypothetical protein